MSVHQRTSRLSSSWRRTVHRLAWIGVGGLAVLLVAGLFTYMARVPILTWIGGQLVHVDPLERSDAIVILGGSEFAEREIEAADLYLAGYAPRVIVLVGREPAATAELKRRQITVWSLRALRLDQLRELGVPVHATTVMDETVDSTLEEAQLMARWTASEGVESLIIVTSTFHSARARFIFQKVFEGREVQLRMRPTSVNDFQPDTWWGTRPTLRNGLFEWQKLVFYRLWY